MQITMRFLQDNYKQIYKENLPKDNWTKIGGTQAIQELGGISQIQTMEIAVEHMFVPLLI